MTRVSSAAGRRGRTTGEDSARAAIGGSGLSADALRNSASEDELLQAIVEAALFLGWLVHHDRRSDKALQQGSPGFPDLVLARAGIVIFAELKSETGNLTTGQLAWRFEFPPESHWFRYRLWQPRDLDAALEELAKP